MLRLVERVHVAAMSVQSIDDARRRQPSSSGGREMPNNVQAEESLLSAILWRSDALTAAAELLSPDDFWNPAHGHVFAAALRLHRRGDGVDPVTVTEALRADGLLDACGGPTAMVTLRDMGGVPSNARKYAKTIAGLAVLRRLIAAAGEIAEVAYTEPDAGEAIDRAHAILGSVDLPAVEVPGDLHVLDEFLARPKPAEGRRWLVPGLLKPGWRAIIVAPEGAGKTVALRAIAVGAASGVHPFGAPGTFPPVRALLVDLENPPDAIDDSCGPIVAQAHQLGDYEPGRVHLWHRPGGIDIRRRSDRAAFEAVLAHVRPDVVCLGPLYKLFHRTKGEDTEIAAEEVQAILDDLRTRFSFALVMEHHAPKGLSQSSRELAPFGSQRWMAWPELGITLAPENVKDPSRLVVGRFRYDRVKAAWPNRLDRGVTWPWNGRWEEGMPHA